MHFAAHPAPQTKQPIEHMLTPLSARYHKCAPVTIKRVLFEIAEERRAIPPDLDIRGFQISMHYAFLVRRFESVSNLLRNPNRFFERNRNFFNARGESRTIDVLYYQVIGADVVPISNAD
jgi:hypothetical protein